MRIRASVTRRQCQFVMDEIVNNLAASVYEISQTLNITVEQVNEAFLYLDQEKIFENLRLVKDVNGNYAFVSTSGGIVFGEKGMDFRCEEPDNEFVEIDVPEIQRPAGGEHQHSKKDLLPTIFVSYNRGSTEYVDKLDQALEGKAQLHRDTKKIGSWQSISEFMDTIRDQDFAILVISDAYLKSVNCMYEVMQLMKEKDYKQRMMPIVLRDANIYDPLERLEYIQYWTKYCKDFEMRITGLSPASIADSSAILRKCNFIRDNIDHFMDDVADSNNPREEQATEKILDRIHVNQADNIGLKLDKSVFNFDRNVARLSAHALELLKLAGEGDGVISTLETMDGVHVFANYGDLTADRNRRSMAMWSSALDELIRNNLVSRRLNGNYPTYDLTFEAFQLFDNLK